MLLQNANNLILFKILIFNFCTQVCSLVWVPAFKEIVSGHGFANNQLIIWRYPALTKVKIILDIAMDGFVCLVFLKNLFFLSLIINQVTELTGHTARVLHLALSPDGTTVLSAGADETLRMWRCFVSDKKKENCSKTVKTSILKPHIR